MPDQRSRSLTILAIAQAVASGLSAMVIFALYGLRPSLLSDTGVSLTAAILGITGVVYFISIHQLLGRKHQSLSTLILTFITSANFILIIASTGGLDSPYYSLWLLAIVVAGIFGTAQTLITLGVTIAFYIYSFATSGLNSPNTRDHFIQLGITLVAAALAEWVHSRNRQARAAVAQLGAVTGQLSAEQLKADAIVASIGEGVMVIDAGKRIQLFNKAACDLSGWDEGSAITIDYNLVLQLKTPDGQVLTEATDPFNEAWKKGSPVTHDNLTMISRSGRKTQLNISISPLFDAKHQPSGAIALFRDISQEKENERQKDEFISTASHEMRTPVAAIEGYIALAMNPNVATIDDRAKKYLDKAHDTIGHLGQLFRDLLSVTKAEEGVLSGKVGLVDITKLLQGAVDDMQFTAQKKKLTLVFQLGTQTTTGKAIAPLYYVAANGERLREMVMNLIDNAMKYTPEGGIKVSLDGDDKQVSVAIADTGIGIDAADIPHLFQKFYRIDSTATRTIGGTGLGLYLCRKIIEVSNGRIWVESKVGEGSTFHFTLPRLSQTEVERMQALADTAATNVHAAGAPTAGSEAPPTPAPAAPTIPAPAVNPAPLATSLSAPVTPDAAPFDEHTGAPLPAKPALKAEAMPIPGSSESDETDPSVPNTVPHSSPAKLPPAPPSRHTMR